MKAISSVLAILLSCGIQAAVRTVSNSPGQPAQFTTIQDAITASTNGDTIYVMGSSIQYGGGTVDKQLVLIGAGYSVAAPAFSTSIYSMTITAAGSGSWVIGIDCPYIIYAYGNNITIERSKIENLYLTSTGQNNVIRRCYLSYLDIASSQSVLVSNNIFHGAGYAYNSSSPNVILTNNLFMGNPSYALYSISNALVTNNIFWGSTPVHGTVSSCTFTKNLTFLTSNNTIPYGTNVGTGNMVGANPQFTNAPLVGVNYTYDYRLLPSSPGKNNGTDGTDIGIFGGAAPMPGLGGQPPIPLVTLFTLQNAVVPQGGSLNVQVKAKKVN